MNRLLTMLALAISIAANAQDTLRLSVMTFNLRFGERTTNEQIARLIKSHNPDFVALQEMDAGTKRVASPHQNGRNMLSEIAAATDMFGIYGKTIDFAGGYYGIGILSKYPYITTKKTMLPNPANAEQRALTEGLFEIGNDTIVFASTHLDVESEETRKIQAAAIIEHFKDSKYPVILGGDFNTSRNSEAIKLFTGSEWTELTNDAPTFPAQNPEEKLDYILAFPADRWTTTNMLVIPTELSDHRPVVAEIIATYKP